MAGLLETPPRWHATIFCMEIAGVMTITLKVKVTYQSHPPHRQPFLHSLGIFPMCQSQS